MLKFANFGLNEIKLHGKVSCYNFFFFGGGQEA